MYIEAVTSNQILRYVMQRGDLQAGVSHTDVGPCADFVLNVIEQATHSSIDDVSGVFNKCLTRISEGALIRDINELMQCTPGDILAVVRNDGDINNNVVHYMLYIGDVNTNNAGHPRINVIGLNGNYFNGAQEYHGAIGCCIDICNLSDGIFNYDVNGSYSLYCIKYGLL